MAANLVRHPDLELRVSPVLDGVDFEALICRPATGGGRWRVTMERSEEFVGVAAGACRDGQAMRSLSAAWAAHADLRASDGQSQLVRGRIGDRMTETAQPRPDS